MNHPQCPECKHISGLTIPSPVDKASLRVNPFDSSFDGGVMMYCARCGSVFRSVEIVAWYRTQEYIRIMFRNLARKLPEAKARSKPGWQFNFPQKSS